MSSLQKRNKRPGQRHATLLVQLCDLVAPPGLILLKNMRKENIFGFFIFNSSSVRGVMIENF